MWYKIEEIEEKYGLTKFSIYALITQEPELRKYIKALEGVLQINEQGIGVLLKHASKRAENQDPATYADNNTIIMKKDDYKKESKPQIKTEPEVKSKSKIEPIIVPEAKDTQVDLFADAFNTEGSFFEETPAKEDAVATPTEDFFANIDLDYSDQDVQESFMDEGLFESKVEVQPEPVEEVAVEETSSFADDLIFPDEEASSDIEEDDEVNPGVYDDLPNDDFFSDELGDPGFLDLESPAVTEIKGATEDDFTMEGYLKALKEKMIIQNEQIRALSNYLDVSKKMLIQDEKIVNILEGMSRSK